MHFQQKGTKLTKESSSLSSLALVNWIATWDASPKGPWLGRRGRFGEASPPGTLSKWRHVIALQLGLRFPAKVGQ